MIVQLWGLKPLGTVWYPQVLFGTLRYCSVPSDTVRYPQVLFGDLRYCSVLVTDRDLGLGLGRDCLFGGISVLGRDSSNLGREPRHNKLRYFSNFHYSIEKLLAFCNSNFVKRK